jgi:cytochrome b6-f complex iron-sulfur subunit
MELEVNMKEKNESIVHEEPKKVSRRDLLKTTWLALGGLTVLEMGGISLSYMQPRLAEGEFGSIIEVGEVDSFPPGSVTHISNGRFYLSRLADGGFLAIYQRCTHLGCNVPWDQAANAFVCPCHNSEFTANGEVLNPPAPRPLDLFPITIENNIIRVDTGKTISRQNSEPVAMVYP